MLQFINYYNVKDVKVMRASKKMYFIRKKYCCTWETKLLYSHDFQILKEK